MPSFGTFIKDLRLKMGLGLREFCLKYGHDPSNWSKIERDKLSPPKDRETLEKWAEQLGLKEESKEWYLFFDLASISKGNIPSDILSDKELANMLPLFFRTVRGQKPSKDELLKLAEKMRRA